MGLPTVLRGMALSAALLLPVAASAQTPVPAPGESPKIDAIKARGTLLVAAIGEFPWLPENTTGSRPQFSGPAWVLAEEYAKRLGVKLEVVPVSHETKVPILATGERRHLDRAARRHAEAAGGGRFRCLFAVEPLHVRPGDNPKLKDAQERRRPQQRRHHHGLFHRHAAGDLGADALPQGAAPRRRRLRRQRSGRGDHGRPRRRRHHRQRRLADSSPKQVPGLIVFPPGDDCLQSHEMKTGVGLAVDKKDTVFRDWLQAVYDEIKDKVTAEEIRILRAEPDESRRGWSRPPRRCCRGAAP